MAYTPTEWSNNNPKLTPELMNKLENGVAAASAKADLTEEEVDETNSNLDTLEFGEVAGGKNLVLETLKGTSIETNGKITLTESDFSMQIAKVTSEKTYTVTTDDIGNLVCGFFTEKPIVGSVSYNNSRLVSSDKTVTIPSGVSYIAFRSTKDYTTPQIEEGTTATSYEPYIPSVKMIAEENAQQNTEAMDLKMLGWNVPSECPIQNEVNGNQFIQKVGRVDLEFLSSIQLSYWEGHGYHTTNSVASILPVKATGKCYTNKYPYSETGWVDGTCSITSEKKIIFADGSYADVSAFRNAMRGQYLYYELETPITMQIDGHEAIEQIKESLANYGLDNKSNKSWVQGVYGSAGTLVSSYNYGVADTNYHTCSSDNIVSVKMDNLESVDIVWYNGTTMLNRVSSSATNGKAVAVAPTNTTQFLYSVRKAESGDALTPNNVKDVYLYVGNEIDSIKNDLDKLNSLPKGSIIQIDADKDDIETTTQKYGWQYLGTSNIQYENGSLTLLVTNVYRKNN